MIWKPRARLLWRSAGEDAPHRPASGAGMRFDMAYCNQAVCAPSRFTLMLGTLDHDGPV
ncbi:MAG: hypothetical protein IPK32_26380 [Verrucomicrobiaceae bacterium]|nr:hypothetical protein [Verrucomicrobiaceae bacterium]